MRGQYAMQQSSELCESKVSCGSPPSAAPTRGRARCRYALEACRRGCTHSRAGRRGCPHRVGIALTIPQLPPEHERIRTSDRIRSRDARKRALTPPDGRVSVSTCSEEGPARRGLSARALALSRTHAPGSVSCNNIQISVPIRTPAPARRPRDSPGNPSWLLATPADSDAPLPCCRRLPACNPSKCGLE